MHIPLYLRIGIMFVSLASLFWFPWSLTLVFIFFAGMAFPPAAFALGVLADLLYYPGHGLIGGSIEGLLIMLVAISVRHFVKTRII